MPDDVMRSRRNFFRLITIPMVAFGLFWLVAFFGEWLTNSLGLSSDDYLRKARKYSDDENLPYMQRVLAPLEATFERRRRSARYACRKAYAYEPSMFNATTAASKLNADSKQFLLVDDVHKVLFCSVPYTDSLEWKKLLIVMTEESEFNFTSQISDDVAKDDFYEWPKLTPLSKLSSTKVVQVLQDYRKIMVVRNPIDKVITAWRDLLNGDNEEYSDLYGQLIARRYRHKALDVKRKFLSVRLREFLDFLIHEGLKHPDPAWMPQHLHCGNCVIAYDTIAKYEEMSKESQYVIAQILGSFRKLNAKGWKFKPAPTTMKYDNKDALRSTASRAIIDNFIRAYAADFDIFEYDSNFV